MTENDNVDEEGYPLWYRLGQALCAHSQNVCEDHLDQAKHTVRRLEQRRIVLALAPAEL